MQNMYSWIFMLSRVGLCLCQSAYTTSFNNECARTFDRREAWSTERYHHSSKSFTGSEGRKVENLLAPDETGTNHRRR